MSDAAKAGVYHFKWWEAFVRVLVASVRHDRDPLPACLLWCDLVSARKPFLQRPAGNNDVMSVYRLGVSIPSLNVLPAIILQSPHSGAQFNSDSENDSENNYENDSEILPESNIKKFKNLKFRHV